MNDYLSLLNNQQREAVEYVSGPQLVIAGAGAGKTRVLTYKIVHLLNLGYEPYRILALTFTNKAAREMKERIAGIIDYNFARRLWMGTFHSVFLRILRTHHELIGFKSNFSIYDTNDSRSLIKSIIRDLQLDDKIYKPAIISAIISNAKNSLILPEQYLTDSDYIKIDRNARRPMTGKIYQLYAQRCRLANAMDFDDILLYMNLLMRDNADIRRHYQQFFQYILVDEYQDTNFAQHMIITYLAGEQQNLCVVGDDAQSIYSFRGANITNILNLQHFYPTLEVYKLEQNYRSTKNIIGAANSLIAHNKQQIQKKIFSKNGEGNPINEINCYSDIEESAVVASDISQSKLTQHNSYDDYAVLYRTNAQSRLLEEALRKRNIPYRIYGGLSFYQRKEIKDALSYFRLTTNLDDDEALKRIINYPARGIGETTKQKIIHAANESSVSMWEVIVDPDKFALKINSGTKNKLQGFINLIKEFIEDNESGNDAYNVGQLIYNRTGLLSSLAHDDTPESISQKENLEELLRNIKDFVDEQEQLADTEYGVTLQDFLSQVSLATDQDETDDENMPKVTLMTVHAAKGLEFGNIYVVGVEEGLFPSSMSMDSIKDIEEERRLLYVAITRAKTNCTLTHCKSRFRHGKEEWPHPSRFIKEIDIKYLYSKSSCNIPTTSAKTSASVWQKKYSTTSNSYFKSEQNTTNLQMTSQRKFNKYNDSSNINQEVEEITLPQGKVYIGTKIEHNLFGPGKIVKIESSNSSNDATLHVQFDNHGLKKLLSRFAKFTIC